MKPHKQAMAAWLNTHLTTSQTLVIADFTGLPVNHMNAVRKNMNTYGGHMRVCKNKVSTHALKESWAAPTTEYLHHNTALIFSQQDPIELAKNLKSISDKYTQFKVTSMLIKNHKDYGRTLFEYLYTLPSKPAIIQGLYEGLSAPLTGLVGNLSFILYGLIHALETIQQQKANNKE